MHDCCSVCKSHCDCATEECTTNTNEEDDHKDGIAIRIVNTEDHVLLKDALMELLCLLTQTQCLHLADHMGFQAS